VFQGYNGSAYLERARIDSSGNLGIGTTDPDIFSTAFARNLGVFTSGASTTTAINVSGGAASRIQFGVGTTRYGIIYQDASNFMQISTTTALPISFTTDGVERIRIPSNASGITFPATQVASANANTLDDYEEGTWTAVISTESGTNYTITSQTSRYTKIGNVVTVSCEINYSAIGSGTISKVSLPFSPLLSPITTIIMGTITGPSGSSYLTDLALIPYSGNEMILRVSAADTNYWSASNNFRSSGTLAFNGSFITYT